MRINILVFVKISFFTLILFIFSDLIIGNYVYKKILRNNYFDRDTNMGTLHPTYHHGIKKNYFTSSAGWGTKKYYYCSDNFGFRNLCNKKYNSKKFDIGIIGDSQTEGYGISFDDTFSHLISKKLQDKKIANLAVASYSPAIYYAKINYLLKNDFFFKEIIVFLDLTDLHDDATRYELVDDRIKALNIDFEKENFSLGEKTMRFLSKYFKVTNYIINSIDKFFIKNHFKERKIPYWVENNFRSSWTYDFKKEWYNNKSFDEVKNSSLNHMNKLSELLKEKEIGLSIAVFPHPATIKNEVEENLQVKIWKNFCINKCVKFYNFMEPFFAEKNKIGYRGAYFKYFIDGDIHLNENGHRLIAESFLNKYD